MYGLYLHIPYCVRKCHYCDFYSVATSEEPIANRVNHQLDSDNSTFLDALEAELKQLPTRFAPHTIFVGGGTPTELSDVDFARLLDMVHRYVDLNHLVEWTCESNPGTLTPSKVEMFTPAGINRVSLGVQSFQASSLEFLGRIHSAEEAMDGYHLLRDHGIENINLDLIFGVPGATREMFITDIETMLDLRPEHTSCYNLMYEEGTPLTRMLNQKLIRPADSEEELEQYHLVRDRYQEAGYAHYEISNFALPGRECRHNLLYWGAGEYIGCGPSAHSHWTGQRYSNVRSIKRYGDALLNNRSARDFEERLEPRAKARETLVMGLRCLDGVDRTSFARSTGFDLASLYASEIDDLCAQGLLRSTNQTIALTEKGLFVSDTVFAELV